MKPLKTLALIPILAAAGFAVAQVAVPAAHGDDTVKVHASILFNLNGGATGYVSYGEPVYERIIERAMEPSVVYVYREPLCPVYSYEHARPVVIVKKDYRDYYRSVWGHGNGHYRKAAREVVVMQRNNRGNDRYDRGNDRNIRGNDRNNRGYAKQDIENRKAKHDKND